MVARVKQSLMTKVQSLKIPGPVGGLETLLKFREHEKPAGLAVVCHPHPLFQGTMHNKVVFALAEAFFALGFYVLRFNFRGTGLSEGIHDHGNGEVEDALAAVHFLRKQHPSAASHIAGFSFGARVAIAAAERSHEVTSLTAVSPSIADMGPSALRDLETPKLFIQGTADKICPADELQSRYPGFAKPKRIILIEAADHFFTGRLQELKDAVTMNRDVMGIEPLPMATDNERL